MRFRIFTHFLVLTLLLTGFISAKAQDSTCTAQFIASVSQNQAFFTAVDSQTNILQDWSFGDGASSGFSSRFSSISHVYANAGTYRVTHIIRDSLGGSCFDSSFQNISITLPPACQISFQSTRDSFNYHIYSFFSTAVNSSGGTDTISWFINDRLAGSGANLLNHYFKNGTYTVCAKLNSSSGCQAEQCAQITIAGSDSSCGIPPSFSYTPNPSNSQKITFTPSPDSSGFKYLWNFGDSGVSSARMPVHLYAAGGYYTVTLQLTRRDDSCVTNTAQTIFVTERDTCVVGFTYKANPKKSNEVTFTAKNSQALDSVTWIVKTLYDSTVLAVLSGKQATYTFLDSGCYSVVMTAATVKGCTGSASGTVCIDSIPKAGNEFIVAYPNPAGSQAYIDMALPADYSIHIGIFNLMGNNVQNLVVAGYKGQNHITIPTGGLPTGLYYVQIQYGSELRNSKIQKL